MSGLRMVRFWVGVSGFSYQSWRGTFYPEKAKPDELLNLYSAKLNSVEVNSSFYTMPNAQTCKKWSDATPGDFSFSFKANRRITHVKKLKDVEGDTDYFLDNVGPLDPKMGCLLVQLPPFMRRDLGLLEKFLDNDKLRRSKVALEFRNDSWFTDDTLKLLSEAKAALCVAETEEMKPVFENTASFVYARLRRDKYSNNELQNWAGKLAKLTENATDCYVYFKHDETGEAANMALRFRQMLESKSG